MKKLFGLLSLLVYIVSTNALAHAQSMGILPDHQMMMGTSCHGHHDNTPSSKQSIDCCELVYSNQYSHQQIKPTSIQQIFSLALPTTTLPSNTIFENKAQYIFSTNFSPGRNPDIKYQKFSDLTGSIVNLA